MNNWELHKKYIKEGHNPSEIARIILNDEIDKFREISSQTNFDFDQYIEPSLYERCSFINKKKVSLIDYAAFFGSIKCFKLLLVNGAKLDKTGKYAVAGGNEEIIHLCEQNHSSFEDAYETAIEFHQNDIFKYLYENKLENLNENMKQKDINDLGNICIKSGNYEIFLYLLEKRMKINESTINEAAKIGNLYLVKHFLQNNLIPSNILTFAIDLGNSELVKYVLEQGVDINAKDITGNTALIYASLNDHIETVKLLLEQEGIDINAKDCGGETALIYASDKGNTEIVKLLLEQEGIDINAKDNLGNTALMFASWNGHTEIVKLLLEQEGIDINAKDKDGNTALSLAEKLAHLD